MRVALVAGVLFVALLIAGIPGLVGLAPRIENEPWGVTTYEFVYHVDVGNFGTAPARNLTARVALLRTFEPFQVVDSMVVATQGSTIEEDELGNQFAVYNMTELAPGASFMADFTARVRVFGIDFTATDTGLSGSPGPEYTSPEPFVESADTRIINQSLALRGVSTGLADYAYRSYVWTTHHLTYETQPQERGAAWALRTGRGMCYEYANLYMALLRAQGVPSKRVNGWGERFQAGEVHHAEEVAHAWDLLFSADHGWIPVDPTFGDKHEYEYFLKINDMHVILTEGVNRHFYRITYTRTAGTNVQVDYVVTVLSKVDENLSAARAIVIGGFVAVPFLLAAVIVAQVVTERRKRVYLE